MKQSNLFWGPILIGIGSLLLLGRIGILNFDWWQLLKLWPFLIILWGVSILPVKSVIKVALVVLTLAASVWLYVAQTERSGSNRRPTNTWSFNLYDEDEEDSLSESGQSFSEAFPEGIQKATLEMDASAGLFSLQGSTGELIYADSHGFGNDFIFKVATDSTEAKISIKQQSGSKILHTKGNNTFNMMLNTTPVWDFDFDVGAAKFDLDLSNHKVNHLAIDGGGTAIELKFGTLQPETDVKINAGASSVVIYIPSTAGCKITGSTILSNRDLDGFTRIDRGHYETPGFDGAPQKIRIKVDAAASNFKVSKLD